MLPNAAKGVRANICHKGADLVVFVSRRYLPTFISGTEVLNYTWFEVNSLACCGVLSINKMSIHITAESQKEGLEGIKYGSCGVEGYVVG